MQRTVTMRYRKRNIGGDRARVKLFYTTGLSYIATEPNLFQIYETFPFNVGMDTDSTFNRSIAKVLGETPNLSTLSLMYLKYRIRGIKLKLTAYYVPAVGDPVMCLFTNATASTGLTSGASPVPNFPDPAVNILPEQRWARYRVIANQGQGAKPTTLSVYYSVNKVQGPDAVVKNDVDYTGNLQTTFPFWSATAGFPNRPQRGPWIQWGVFPMDQNVIVPADLKITLKVEATVYTEFFGKRVSIQ